MCTFQRTTKAAWFSSRRFVRKDFWYKIGVVINPRLFDFKQAHTWDSADNGLTRRTYVFSFQIFFYVYIIVFCYSRNDIMCSTRNTFIINLRRDYCLTSYLVPFMFVFFFFLLAILFSLPQILLLPMCFTYWLVISGKNTRVFLIFCGAVRYHLREPLHALDVFLSNLINLCRNTYILTQEELKKKNKYSHTAK